MHITERFSWRRGKWRAKATVLLLAAAMALSVAAVVQAHDTLPLPDHRFFGFPGDVTIDGEPITEGMQIVAMIEGKTVSKAAVSADGSWYIDVVQADLVERPCNVSLTFDGLPAKQKWDDCPTRVVVDLDSPDGQDPPQSEDLKLEEELEEEPSDEGLMMSADEPSAPSLTGTSNTAVGTAAPGVPSTGSGGLLRDESRWPSAAAITGILMFVVVAVALLIGRRTDSAR